MGGTTRGGNERGAIRSAELIESAADLLLTRGLVDLSLRTMATQLDTSHRMLLYYFESRENLVATALDTLIERLDALLQTSVVSGPVGDGPDHPNTRRLIDFMNGPDCEPYRRLLLEAWPLVGSEPEVYGRFVDPRELWLPAIQKALAADGVPADEIESVSTLLLATLNGLFIGGQTPGLTPSKEDTIELLWNILGNRPRAA